MKESLRNIDVVARENFGPGKAGEIAYLTISQGVPCESISTHEEKSERPRASRTVGFDVSSHYEFIAVCSDSCEEETKKILEKDLLAAGQIPSFDRNGFGRA
jgi:hypothetical protein